jgi:hypothetical protein
MTTHGAKNMKHMAKDAANDVWCKGTSKHYAWCLWGKHELYYTYSTLFTLLYTMNNNKKSHNLELLKGKKTARAFFRLKIYCK